MGQATAWRRFAGFFARLAVFGRIDAKKPAATAADFQGIAVDGSRRAGKNFSRSGAQISNRSSYHGEQNERHHPRAQSP